LSDGKAELEQFAVDAWRPPKRVLDAHSPDQCAQVRFDLRAPSPVAVISTASSSESPPDANARAFQVGQS